MNTSPVPETTAHSTVARADGQSESAKIVRPRFVVGVTGQRDLILLPQDVIETLKAAVRQIRDFIITAGVPDGPPEFREGLAIDPADVCLLSSMAPGADALVAEIFREKCAAVAPLPFPLDQYLNTTSFKHPKDSTQELAPDSKPEELKATLHSMQENGQTFFVPLQSDRLLTPKELDKKLAEDMNDKSRRRLRYRAAGEYVAGYSQLLIAMTNESVQDEIIDDAVVSPVLELSDESASLPPGSSAVVQVKRKGMTHGLISEKTAITWEGTGPVIHVYTPRPETANPSAPASVPNPAIPPKPGTISTLYPIDAKVTPGRSNNFDRQWQQHGREMFLRTVKDLKQFNKLTATVDDRRETAEACKLLGLKTPPAPRWRSWTYLESLARVRSRASGLSGKYSTKIEILYRTLFILTLAAAICLHLAAHWGHKPKAGHQPTEDHKNQSEPVAARDESPAERLTPALFNADQPRHVVGARNAVSVRPNFLILAAAPTSKSIAAQSHKAHPSGHISPFQWVASILGFICFVTALRLLSQSKKNNEEVIRLDSRALAEGLRVQFYWAAAGLGESVPANYLDRQRSELDWLRHAIRSLAAPYYRARDWFHELPTDVQLGLLHRIVDNWIVGQRDYFAKQFHEYSHALHFWHRFGCSLALSGVGMAFVWLAFGTLDLHFPIHSRTWLGCGLFVAAIPIIAVMIAAATSKREKGFLKTAYGGMKCLFSFPFELCGLAERWKKVGYVVWVPYFLCVSLWVCSILASFQEGPEFGHWLIIAMSTLLVAGALGVAWPERNLYAEHAFQFNVMATFLSAAGRRLHGHLREIDTNLGDATIVQQRIEAVQRILREVGIQALDENAEWLMLHRARPFEPVMAG